MSWCRRCTTATAPVPVPAVSANQVDQALGGKGEIAPMPRIEEVDDLDGGPGYPVITGDYTEAPTLGAAPVVVGTPVAKPSRSSPSSTTRWSTEELARLGIDGGVVSGPNRAAATPTMRRLGARDASGHRHRSRCRRRSSTTTATSTSPDGDDWLDTGEALALGRRGRRRPRIVQIGCDLPGARWAVEVADGSTTRSSPAWRCTRTRRRSWPSGRRARRRRWPRSSGWRRRALACGPSARPGWTTTGPVPRAWRRRRSRSRRTSRWRSGYDKALVIHDRDAHDDVLRDAR